MAERADANGAVVISTQGLSKRYKKLAALKPLTLQVHRNSIFGFLGPNGAGKPTAIMLLLGLIHPTGGSASVFGLDIVHDSVLAASVLFVAIGLWAFQREEL